MFRFESSPVGPLICVEGDVNASNCGPLAEAIAAAEHDEADVFVSLEACERVDADAIIAFARTRARLGDRLRFAVVGDSQVHRRLAGTAVHDAIIVVPSDLAESLARAECLQPRGTRSRRGLPPVGRTPSPARRRRDARRSMRI